MEFRRNRVLVLEVILTQVYVSLPGGDSCCRNRVLVLEVILTRQQRRQKSSQKRGRNRVLVLEVILTIGELPGLTVDSDVAIEY